MGIRFECPQGHKLNVKAFLAGKRGICPHCDAKFIIPESSGSQAVAVEEAQEPDIEPPPTLAKSATTVAPPEVLSPPPAPVTETEATDVWYVKPARGEEQYGPANIEEMQTWIAEKRVAPDSWVWRTGWPEWKFGSEALEELNSPAAHNPPSLAGNELTPHVELATPGDRNSATKKQARESPRSRQLRAQKITVVLGALVLLLGVAVILVLSIQ